MTLKQLAEDSECHVEDGGSGWYEGYQLFFHHSQPEAMRLAFELEDFSVSASCGPFYLMRAKPIHR